MIYFIHKSKVYILSVIFILFIIPSLTAQKQVTGRIFDQSHYVPLPNVGVRTSSGYVTKTDSIGNYLIMTKGSQDSIWFSYLGKNTVKYPIDTIKYTFGFDLGISVRSPLAGDKHWLTPVIVRNHTYRQDSLQNRLAYEKVFHPDKGGFKLSNAQEGTFGVGIDVDALINSFRFKYNKRQEMYKQNAIEEEQYKYVNYRFNKKLIEAITDLDSNDITAFMKQYRPNYFNLTLMNDADLGKYITDAKNAFLQKKNKIYNDPFSTMFKRPKVSN